MFRQSARYVTAAANDDNTCHTVVIPEKLQHFEAVHIRHENIQHDNIGLDVLERLCERFRPGCAAGIKTRLTCHMAHKAGDSGIVLHHKQAVIIHPRPMMTCDRRAAGYALKFPEGRYLAGERHDRLWWIERQ